MATAENDGVKPGQPPVEHSPRGDWSGGRKVNRVSLSMTWWCGGALAICLVMVLGLFYVLAVNGFGYFYPKPLVQIALEDGTVLLGEEAGREEIPGFVSERGGDTSGTVRYRTRLKVGNRDLTGRDFVWYDEDQAIRREEPADAILLERTENGNFYGFVESVWREGQRVASGRSETLVEVQRLLERKISEREVIEDFEAEHMSPLNARIEELRLREKTLRRRSDDAADLADSLAEVETERATLEARYDELTEDLFAQRELFAAETVKLVTVDGREHEMPIGEIVRAVPANQLSGIAVWRVYASRVWEFLTADPRESNTEGGIFPAIFGTVMMVFLMCFAVVPLGVLTALYLHEYARDGVLVRLVRIAVNNLAGVPSIVFGVFGLGFFVYTVGGSIDRFFFADALPAPTFGTGGILWGALTLALLTVPVVIVATEEGLSAVPSATREGSVALGATRWETTWRVVVPAAAPGILTGVILAVARAAGEVAPLMIVGMVKLAPTLPVDGQFPYVHLERKFMHLGFHIFDIGFQSPNVEAAKPLVFATALLLVGIVVVMNIVAITLRNHLRRKYAASAV